MLHSLNNIPKMFHTSFRKLIMEKESEQDSESEKPKKTSKRLRQSFRINPNYNTHQINNEIMNESIHTRAGYNSIHNRTSESYLEHITVAPTCKTILTTNVQQPENSSTSKLVPVRDPLKGVSTLVELGGFPPKAKLSPENTPNYGERLQWENDEIILFVKEARKRKYLCEREHIIKLQEMMDKSVFDFFEVREYKYDPNSSGCRGP